MLPKRKIKLSFREAIVNLCTTPPASSGLSSGYNIYGEVELRDKKHKPVWPWLYIIDNAVQFTVIDLPLIAIIFQGTTKYEHEIGNMKRRRLYTVTLSVLGRNRGEREDIVDFLTEHLETIPIKDYDQSGNPVVATGELDSMITEIPVSVGPEEAKEGSLRNWTDIQLSFRVDPWY